MKKFYLFGILTLLVCVSCASLPNSSQAHPDESTCAALAGIEEPSVGGLEYNPDFAGSEPYQLAWFYRPPVDGDSQKLAENFDFFILTMSDEPFRDELKAELEQVGKSAKMFQYFSFDLIHDPCGLVTEGNSMESCDDPEPNTNNVAWLPEDLSEIIKLHPDWFLRDPAGNIHTNGNYVYMDPGNEGWRQFWVARVLYSQEQFGWDALFMDNVEGSLDKHRSFNRNLMNYQTDEQYINAITGFLDLVYEEIAQDAGIEVFANIIATPDDTVFFRYMQYLDGAMDEAFAVDWTDGFRDVEDWNLDLTMAECAQAYGKQMILVGRSVDRASIERQQFAFASYLLINAGNAYFRYADGAAYNEIWLYPSYGVDLGEPLGPRYLQAGIWQRDFENGYLQVDPTNHTVNLYVNGQFFIQQIDQ